MLKAPAFIFPTKVVFIDDDSLYAKLFISNMENNMNIESYSDGSCFLNQKNSDFLFLPNQINYPDQNQAKALIIKSIKEKINHLKDLISVIIVDLHMPNISGLELCQQIKSPFTYKILISNFLDSNESFEIKSAQNTGVINEVIEKNQHLKYELPKAITRGYLNFFLKISNDIFKDDHGSPLSNFSFSDLFYNFIKITSPDYIWPNYNLRYFNFINKKSLIDRNLCVTCHEEIDALLNSINYENLQEDIVKKISSGDIMISHEDPFKLDGCEWVNHIKPSKVLTDNTSKFIYSLTEDIKT